MSALFVTGTGTGIGKTFVAAGLIRHWRSNGETVDAIKPVVSGYDPAQAADSDPAVLLSALGRPPTEAEIARMSPFRFAAPLSPDMAARREGRALDFEVLLQVSRDAIEQAAGHLLIEGVGGVMAPLDERHTVLDWIAALDRPVILVAGSYLGSLSHTLTAVAVLRQRGVTIARLIVNETPDSTVPLDETVETLTRFGADLDIRALRRNASESAFASLAAGL